MSLDGICEDTSFLIYPMDKAPYASVSALAPADPDETGSAT
ncbi:hypothetical protein ACFYY1_39060 [Streptomyces sp. NPDC001890]